MKGLSWLDETNGASGVEIWDSGIVVWIGNRSSARLTDRQQILSLYHTLGDWLITHPPELSDPS